ncbi:MAG: hypothetical protein V4636_15080 [Pseudomonadota bacterium]
MKHLSLSASAGILLLALLFGSPVRADDGHGHSHGDAPPAAAGPALPRFTATSDLFELVGVLDGQTLTLYLDHAADNSPVKDARLEVEFGGAPLTLKPHGEGSGEFEATLTAAPKPGQTPITATVITPAASDLLAGELDIHEDAHHEETVATSPTRIAAWAVGGIALLALLAWTGRRLLASGTRRVGGAA